MWVMGVILSLGKDPLFFSRLPALLSPKVDLLRLDWECSVFLAMQINDLSLSISF